MSSVYSVEMHMYVHVISTAVTLLSEYIVMKTHFNVTSDYTLL